VGEHSRKERGGDASSVREDVGTDLFEQVRTQGRTLGAERADSDGKKLRKYWRRKKQEALLTGKT